MNIFFLSKNTKQCAAEHCDRHVVKMIVEYAQLLSTAHRVLDGTEYEDRTKNGRRIKRWKMHIKKMDEHLYKATHANHPSAIWARSSIENYNWLYDLWRDLMVEYTYRYGKRHACEKLIGILFNVPKNIQSVDFTEPPQAMPEECKRSTVIEGYRNYYKVAKKDFATWKKDRTPKWFLDSPVDLFVRIKDNA